MKYKWNLISGDQVLDIIWTDNNDPEEAMEVFRIEHSLCRTLTAETLDQVYVELVHRYPVDLEYYQTVVDTQRDPEILIKEMQDLIDEAEKAFDEILKVTKITADMLEQAPRYGSDSPENIRIIQLSDKLAQIMAVQLRELNANV